MSTNVNIGYESVFLKISPLEDGVTSVTQVLTPDEARILAGQLYSAACDLDMKLMCRNGSKQDVWIAACGGTETPFMSRSGKRLLYCYNPGLQKHAYLDLGTDIILTDEEAALALEMV
jgi:hypothetical protein